MLNKKILILILALGILASAASLQRTEEARANVFDDILNFFKNQGQSTATTTPQTTNTPRALPLYKPVVDYEEAVVSVAEVASPWVVSIVVTKDLPTIEQCPYNPFGNLPPEFRRFFNDDFGLQFNQPCEKGTQKQEVGGGSGFFVSEDGLIVTNKHVVLDTKADYTVLTNDGKKYSAKVLARDPLQDVALIKIDGGTFPAATLGDSDSVKLGQTAIAIGNSLGEFRNTISVGVISGLARNITASGVGVGSETIQGVMQTDAAINPGNSGGPLLNLRGEVVGINTAIVSGAQNIGFAIPINQAKRAVTSVKRTGTIKVPYLGVRYILITPEIKERDKLSKDEGALVRGTPEGPGVIANSPAAKAGLRSEDIITHINNEQISLNHPLSLLIQKYNVGDRVPLTVFRGNETLTLEITLEERPSSL